MDFRKVLAHYRKQPNNYVQHLWDKIGRQGIKPDYLRDILMFYFQHRIFPPVLQKSFDSVVMKLCEKNTTKKMRSVLIQIIDEVSYCLDPSVIVDGVWMSSSNITNVDLLNCLLHNSSVQTVIDDKIFCRLVVVLTETNLNISSIEDRCKAFTFLTTFYSEKFSIQLSLQMADWLQFSQPVPTSTQLFSRSEVTEIDGSPGNSLTTALSLSNNMSVGHIMSVLTFSQLKIWFSSYCTPSNGNNYNDLIMAALAHCSVLVNQCSKKPSSKEDAVLRISILCEILDILYLLVEINQSLLDESILVVRQIQSHKDVSIRIKIWKFYLSFDKSNAEEYSNRMLKDYVSRCFTVGMDCYELLNTILDNAKILRPLLVKYHPNLFKIFATHPQTLIEEFIELVPYLTKSYDSDDIIEVFHRLVDLPVLSAVVCIHQSPALLQAGYSDQVLSKLHNLYVSNNNPVYEHFIKTTSISQHTSKIIHLYPEFFSQIEKLNTQGLVETCSQAVPLLIDAFLSSAIITESNAAALLPFLLSRLALVFQVPGYKEQFHSLIGDVLKNVFSLHPVLANHSSVLKFITNVKNMELCTTVYLDLIWALGEYTNKSELLSEHFEIVECALWEILSTTNANHNFNHLNIIVTTLARLSCQSQDLLPRTVLSLNKVLGKAQEHDNQLPEVVALHQLSSLLKNPNIASVLLAPAGEGDKTMAAMIKAVTLFTGS